MQIDKTRMALAFVLVLLLFSVLTLIFWDFVRDTIIIPIYYFGWVANLTLRSISQDVYLIIFILISIIIGINTLISAGRLRMTRRSTSRTYISSSRYNHWRRLCYNLNTSSITRDSFVREARRLIVSILAYQNAIDVEDVEERIENETLIVPDVIHTLIQQKRIKNMQTTSHQRGNFVQRLRQRFLNQDVTEITQSDNPVNEIVAYIEHLLEKDYVAN